MSLDRTIAVTGVATTELAASIPHKTSMAVQIEAALAAIKDAGLEKADIDAVITSEVGGYSPRVHIELTERMGMFHKSVCTNLPIGGACPGLSVVLARWLIASGKCRYVLLVSGRGQMGRLDFSTSGSGLTDASHLAMNPERSPDYEQPFGPLVATYYAALAQRHMHDYGTTSRQLASVAVAARKHATLNPDAIMREPITVDDVLGSRLISSPLHVLDCAINSDGGAALVITSIERAKAGRQKPVVIRGLGHAYGAYFTGHLARAADGSGGSLTSTVGRVAADDAFSEAGVDRKDIQFVELDDCFTISPVVQLEDFGFCAKGEGGSFTEDGRLELGGQLPMNTHGGHLSCSYVPSGYLHWIEAVRQIRGQCGARQVPNARLGLVSSVASTAANYGGIGILSSE